MPADGRFDGHVVQGHVDATAEVVAVESVGEGLASDASETSSDESDGDWTFTFSLPESLSDYLVEKGSITVDGISLTVADRDESTFSVAIIPSTYDLTTLSEKAPATRSTSKSTSSRSTSSGWCRRSIVPAVSGSNSVGSDS